MLCVVAPFDQVFPVAADEVSVTDPPSQNVNAPLAETVGADGTAFTVTAIGEEAGELQPFCVTVVE